MVPSRNWRELTEILLSLPIRGNYCAFNFLLDLVKFAGYSSCDCCEETDVRKQVSSIFFALCACNLLCDAGVPCIRLSCCFGFCRSLPQHQQQVVQAVERAKQVTMAELNAIIGVGAHTQPHTHTQ